MTTDKLITDRTASDASNFIVYRNILGTGGTITEEQLEIMLRGSLNIYTLNRIENKMSELQTRLNLYAYMTSGVVTKIWNTSDIFEHDVEIERWQNNLSILTNAFYEYDETPTPPESVLNFQGVNDVEQILVDVEGILDDMISRFRKCGTFKCGEGDSI